MPKLDFRRISYKLCRAIRIFSVYAKAFKIFDFFEFLGFAYFHKVMTLVMNLQVGDPGELKEKQKKERQKGS